jgi:hypothetical protein
MVGEGLADGQMKQMGGACVWIEIPYNWGPCPILLPFVIGQGNVRGAW